VSDRDAADPAIGRRGSAHEVFGVALGLGLTSFGGPIAHLGYFERTYVRERRWISSDEYAGLIALCQMLPGPASSQVGFLIGLIRGGWPGALAAWVGFTLPSAVMMFAFAVLAPHLRGPETGAVLHGLALVAVVVVAQAVWSMAPRLCPDRRRAAIALVAAVLLLSVGGPLVQFAVLAGGALAGAVLCRGIDSEARPPAIPVSLRAGVAALALFAGLLVMVSIVSAGHTLFALAGVFYRAGALVFGGGHVVLPLLRDALVPSGWMSDNTFLAGYGLAQAVPGPLFTVSSYLGAVVAPAKLAPLWAAVALGSMFLPGLLIALAGIPVWTWIARRPAARGALAGVNAAVVGVLGAALYDPIWRNAVVTGPDLAIALTGFLLIGRWRAPPIIIVVLAVVAEVLLGRAGLLG
jgi:chromate transporter